MSLPYTASKLLITLVSPVGSTLLGCAVGLVLVGAAHSPRWRRAGLVIAWLSVAWLWFWSLPVTGDAMRQSVESHYPVQPLSSLPSADVIVLLGGAISPPVRQGSPLPS